MLSSLLFLGFIRPFYINITLIKFLVQGLLMLSSLFFFLYTIHPIIITIILITILVSKVKESFEY